MGNYQGWLVAPVEIELEFRQGVSIPWPGYCVTVLTKKIQIYPNGLKVKYLVYCEDAPTNLVTLETDHH